MKYISYTVRKSIDCGWLKFTFVYCAEKKAFKKKEYSFIVKFGFYIT